MRTTSLKWGYVVLLLVLVIVIVFRDYFSLDEPDILWEIRNGVSPGSYGSYPRFLSEGRPLYGLFVLGGIHLAGTLAHLKYLRIVSVLLTFLFCLVIFKQLRKEGVSENRSFLIAALIFSLPGFSVFICWAEAFPHQLPSILSFCAGILTLKALEKHLGESKSGGGMNSVFLVSAVMIEIVALFFYQTLALAFLLPAFFALILRKEVPVRNKLVFFSWVSFFFFLSLGLYYQFFQSLAENAKVPVTSRGAFGPDIPLKLKWVADSLVEVSKFHLLLFKFNAVQLLFPILTLFLLGRDLFKRKFADLLFLLLFTLLLWLPMLMIKDNWIASRNNMLVGAIWVFYLINRIFELIREPNLPVTAGIGIVFGGIMLCNIWFAWVVPQKKDYAFLHEFVNKLPEVRSDSLVIEVNLPRWDLHSGPSAFKFYSDEFNKPIFCSIWPIEPAIKLFYLEKHPSLSTKDISKRIRVRILKNVHDFSPEVEGRLIHLDLDYPN
jgi:hypothetical protein